MNKLDIPSIQRAEDVYFCPKCGSSSMDLPNLVGAYATCRACKWKGPTEELLYSPVVHECGSPEELAQRLMNELRSIYAKTAAKPILEMLVKWGFLGNPPSKEEAMEYMVSISHATLSSIIATREKLEKKHGN